MAFERCPSCAAAVRPGVDWCTLCYADLRPAPAPVQRAPYPQPSATATIAPQPTPATADALHAPYEHVLAAVYGGATPAPVMAQDVSPGVDGPAQPPARPVGWPCTQCGELNDFERTTCQLCTSAFGATLRTGGPVIDRKRLMIYAIGASIAFLLLVAALTFALTKRPPADGNDTRVPIPSDQGVNAPAPVVPAAPVPVDPSQPALPSQVVAPGQPAVPSQVAPGQVLPAEPGQPAAAQVQPGQVQPGQLPADPNAPAPAQ